MGTHKRKIITHMNSNAILLIHAAENLTGHIGAIPLQVAQDADLGYS